MSTRLEEIARRQAYILEVIRDLDRPVTVFEVAQHLGEPATTIGNLVAALARRGLIVVDHVAPPGRGGRPAAHWTVVGWQPKPMRPERPTWLTHWKPRPDPAAAWMFGACDAA
jgi:predicted ArsR family transcriptional regulator